MEHEPGNPPQIVQTVSSTALAHLGDLRTTLQAGRSSTSDVLALVATMEQTLARLTGAEDVKAVMDGAAMVETWLQKRHVHFVAANAATILRLRAERKLSEFLQPPDVVSGSHHATLPEGVSADLASRCRRLGAIPEALFERIVDEKRGVEELSSAAVLRWAGAADGSYRRGREEHPAPPGRRARPIRAWQASQEGDVVHLAYEIEVAVLLRHFPGVMDTVDGVIFDVLVRRHARGAGEKSGLPVSAAEPDHVEDQKTPRTSSARARRRSRGSGEATSGTAEPYDNTHPRVVRGPIGRAVVEYLQRVGSASASTICYAVESQVPHGFAFRRWCRERALEAERRCSNPTSITRLELPCADQEAVYRRGARRAARDEIDTLQKRGIVRHDGAAGRYTYSLGVPASRLRFADHGVRRPADSRWMVWSTTEIPGRVVMVRREPVGASTTPPHAVDEAHGHAGEVVPRRSR